MGCDIHAMIEKKTRYCEGGSDWWVNAGNPDIDRNYSIFSVLANVRNYNNMPFISKPKGKPEDCCGEFSAWLEDWNGDAHSVSWLTLKELKEFNINQSYYDKRLILSKKDGKINAVCQDTNGTHLGEVGETTIFGVFGSNSWNELILKMEAIGEPENVRLVFFFDN